MTTPDPGPDRSDIALLLIAVGLITCGITLALIALASTYA